ncbi:MAG TPA: tetratricopeptide repeat protein [Chthoniobacteraceae bacterium]|nr:tetratricopeptide repeat protein [Chthoniobacteraceae bacterium]
MELPDNIYQKIEELSREGDSAAEAGDHDRAVSLFAQAFDLLPEPKFEWEAATWLLTALGDTYFLMGDYEDARIVLSHAMHCPDAIGNPFIHMRLGQAQFELGNMERASDELARACIMGGGKDFFRNEDPKYFNYISSILLPPAGADSW